MRRSPSDETSQGSCEKPEDLRGPAAQCNRRRYPWGDEEEETNLDVVKVFQNIMISVAKRDAGGLARRVPSLMADPASPCGVSIYPHYQTLSRCTAQAHRALPRASSDGRAAQLPWPYFR